MCDLSFDCNLLQYPSVTVDLIWVFSFDLSSCPDPPDIPSLLSLPSLHVSLCLPYLVVAIESLFARTSLSLQVQMVIDGRTRCSMRCRTRYLRLR